MVETETTEIRKDFNAIYMEMVTNHFPYAFKEIEDNDGEIMYQAGINNADDFLNRLNGSIHSSRKMKIHLSKYNELHESVVSKLANSKNQKVINSIYRLYSDGSMKNGGPCFSRKGIILPFESSDSFITPDLIEDSLFAFKDDELIAFYLALGYVNTYNMLLMAEKDS